MLSSQGRPSPGSSSTAPSVRGSQQGWWWTTLTSSPSSRLSRASLRRSRAPPNWPPHRPPLPQVCQCPYSWSTFPQLETPPSEATSGYNSLPYMLPPHGPIGPHAALAYAQVNRNQYKMNLNLFGQIPILWHIIDWQILSLQAINAMQSFAARALYPGVQTSQLPDPECLAASIHQLQPAAEIDMRLPITSTYLRR